MSSLSMKYPGIKVSVFGHSPDSFADSRGIIRNIDDAIAIIKRQHLEKDIKFLLNCEPGVSQWVCDALIQQQIPYEVYLSSPPDEASRYWTEAQQERFLWQIAGSSAIHAFGLDNSTEFRITRDMKAIDDSAWTLVFWNGKHQGATYNAMDYAIKNNRIVYNGLDGLRTIDSIVAQSG